MAISKDEVQYIGRLCKIALTSDELESLSAELTGILEQFQVLEEVDTSTVLETTHSFVSGTVMRDDVANDSLDQEQVLDNAPEREGNFFKVKAVLDE